MLILFLIILFLIISFDAQLLRRQNDILFDEIFHAAPENWALYTALFLMVPLPVYLLRRRRFKVFMRRYPPEALIEPPEAPLSLVSDACGIILSWLCWVLLMTMVVQAVVLWYPELMDKIGKLLFLSVFSSALMVGLIYSLTRNYREGFAVWTGLRAEGRKSFLRIAVVPFVMGSAFAFLAASIQAKRPNLPDTPLNEVLNSSNSPWGVLTFIAVAVLVAPFLEEVIFRGYFFSVIRRFKGETPAIVSMAITFAVMHYDQYWGDWVAIAAVTLLGFALTVIRAWSGSTVASIIMHYTYNFFVTVIPVVLLLSSNMPYIKYSAFYSQLNDQQKETLLKQTIGKNPSFNEAYNELAWLYAQEKKNLPQALALIDQALSSDPGNDHYLDTKAEILFQMGRVKDATIIEQKLVIQNPQTEFYKTQLMKFKAAK